jgi:hypothetical protein
MALTDLKEYAFGLAVYKSDMVALQNDVQDEINSK